MNASHRIRSHGARRSFAVLWLSLAATGIALGAEPAPAQSPAQSPDPSLQRPASTDAMPAVAAPAPQSAAKSSAAKSSAASQANPATSAAPAQPGARRPGSDRLDLDTTIVTGNRELPKVLYIVPWKRAEIGDLPPQPLNSLLDEVLTPVDRDVFRREVTYYGAMTGKDGTAAPAATGSEK